MKIVIVPNAFKNSLDVMKTAQAIERGVLKSRLSAELFSFPIADGGDSTLEVFRRLYKCGEEVSTVRGPLGGEVEADWLLTEDGKTAIIEMARASGIGRLKSAEADPMKANTYGTGQLVLESIKRGARKVIIGLGGSATIDGGTGILQALGAQLYCRERDLVENTTNPVLKTVSIDLTGIEKAVFETEFMLLCDVDNPLLGDHGAVKVFGPQKGATEKDMQLLEEALFKWNNLLTISMGRDLSTMKGGGAAGGIAVMMKALFKCKTESGIDFLIRETGLEEKIRDADLVITAEGKVDRQTLGGKGPAGIARIAEKYHVPVIVLAGKAEDPELLNGLFTSVFSVSNGAQSLEEALQSTETDLENMAEQIGNLLAIEKK